MIANLKELNNKINIFTDYIVKIACESTTSGNYFVSVKDACKVAGMGYDDFLEYQDLIFGELGAREEVLEFDYNDPEPEFDINCALDYCPNYEWCEGDEVIFGSYQAFENRVVKPVYQAFDVEDVQPLVVGTITYHDSGEIVEYTDKEKFVSAYASALDSMGPMGCTAKVSSEDDFELRYQISKLQYNEFGEEIEPFEQWKASIQELTSGSIEQANSESRAYFTVRDGFGDDVREAQYPSFEAALKVLRKYCVEHGEGADGAMLGIVCKTEDKTHKCVLVQNVINRYNESVLKPMYNNISWEVLDVPEIELAALKGKQLQYPFDESTQLRIDSLEKRLGIYDRDVDTSGDLYVGKWRVHIVAPGAHYGANNCLTHDGDRSMVEFWDMSVKKGDFPNGQFVSRYYVETLLEDKWGAGPEVLMQHGLCLDGDNADVWSVSGAEMTKVYDWFKNRKLLSGESYLVCHGNVEVNVSMVMDVEAHVRKKLNALPLVREIKDVENFGSTTEEKYVFTCCFTTQANKEAVEKAMMNAFGKGACEMVYENLTVSSPKIALDKVIKDCSAQVKRGPDGQGKNKELEI